MGNTPTYYEEPLQIAQQGDNETFREPSVSWDVKLNDDQTTATFYLSAAQWLNGQSVSLCGRLCYGNGCHRIKIKIEQFHPLNYFSPVQPTIFVGISDARMKAKGM